MAFRTTKSTAYRSALDTCTQLKKYCQDVRDLMAAGPISGNLAIELHERLIRDRATLNAVSAVTGIAAYAQSQEGDGTYNVATEFAAVVAAIESVRDWLITNVNTTSWVTFSTAGVSTKTFSSAATAGARTQLDALVATIE
jgi:hypothetical protein